MKDADKRKLGIGAAILAAGAAAWAFLRPRTASASQLPGNAAPPTGSGWSGDVAAMQRKLNELGGTNLDVDGKAGTQTCRAAEALAAGDRADADVRNFAASKYCGYGLPRAPCGVRGPVASQAVLDAVLNAAEAKGYPRGDVAKAIKRESGNNPMAVACGGQPVHAIAGGLLQFIPVTLKAVGFEGSPDQFASLTGEQQLPYLLKFLSKMPRSVLNLPGDFGLALFMPAYVGKPDDFVIFEVGSLGWEQNPGLRTVGGGPITAGRVRETAR